MSCSLAAIAACFSLSGLYVDGGVAVQETPYVHSHRQQYDFRYENRDAGVVETGGSDFTTERVGKRSDTYSRLTLGYSVEFSPRWSATLEGVASDNVSTSRYGDRVYYSGSFTVRWRPFGNNR